MSHARWWIRTSRPKLEPGAGQLLVVEVDDFLVPWRFEATVVRDDNRGDFTKGAFATDWPSITLQIEIEAGRPIVRELTIAMQQPAGPDAGRSDLARHGFQELRSHQSARAITASLLRELPLARLAKYAMLGVAFHLGQAAAAEDVVPCDLRDDADFYRIGSDQVADDYGVYYLDTPAWQEHWSGQMQTLAAHAERAAHPPQRNRISDELLERVARIYRDAVASGRPPKKAVQANEHVSESTAGRWIARARDRGYLGKTLPGKKGELAGETPQTAEPFPASGRSATSR